MKAKKIKRETWRTTDAEERAKRQERAKIEPMKVRSVDAPDGFGLYEVSHPATDRRTATYRVEIRSPYAFILTGTPLENRIDELYSLVEFVDPQLFGSLFRFNRRFYSFDAEGKDEGVCNLDKLHEATAKVLLRRRKSAVEDELPGRMTKTYKTGMTPEQERRYSRIFKRLQGSARPASGVRSRPRSRSVCKSSWDSCACCATRVTSPTRTRR